MNQTKSNAHGGARHGAGRPRGSKGRRTEEVEEMLERLGCNPLLVLAMIAINDKKGLGEVQDVSIALRQKAASDLMAYVAPKLRSSLVEVTGPQQDQRLVVIADAEFAAHLKESCGDSVEIRSPDNEEG